jgi:hypothetical protein
MPFLKRKNWGNKLPSTLKMEEAYTSEISATLLACKWCKYETYVSASTVNHRESLNSAKTDYVRVF